MIKFRIILAVLVLCSLLGGKSALGQQVLISEMVEIRSINKVFMYVTPDKKMRMVITVLMINGSERQVKFRDTKFILRCKSSEVNVTLPGAASYNTPGTMLVPVDVEVGPLEGPMAMDTISRMASIFNLVGDPFNMTFKMYMEGEGEVGIQTRGESWVYQPYKAEMVFKPQVQREVLIE